MGVRGEFASGSMGSLAGMAVIYSTNLIAVFLGQAITLHRLLHVVDHELHLHYPDRIELAQIVLTTSNNRRQNDTTIIGRSFLEGL